MAQKQSYELIYDPEISQHIAVIDRKYYSLIRKTIKEQLSHEPEVKTRNRKPLEQPSMFGIAWELRFGPDNRFRVFYRTDAINHQVRVLAIGTKVGNRSFIGREEFKL
ncbi:addiction module toxin RelE [candidate division KSB1 bacterium]|nr:addiction module toxin RelE [candidate division KSB1 bacterium]